MFRQPILIVRDPELIRQIMIKDFDHFANRKGIIDPETDPLFGKSLVNLKGKNFKNAIRQLNKLNSSQLQINNGGTCEIL